MPLCQVNIADARLADRATARTDLAAALPRLAPDAPVIVLIHGYKFSPTIDAHDPHGHILSLAPRPCWKAVSWPARLGLGTAGGAEPLCIALGWEARGTLWQAYARAAEAGAALADLVGLIRAADPERRVQVLAHSLGARVALSALPHLPAGALERAVLLAAAEMRSRAARLLDTPAGHTLEALNVTSRENEVFDAALSWLVAPHLWRDRALGRGLGTPAARWLDLRIDDAGHRAALAGLGFRIPAPDRRFCHWSVYLRSGLFELYRAVLAEGLPLDRLAAALPDRAPPSRSRLLHWPALPLPFARGEAS